MEAYGCALNFGESREIEDLLSGKGWELCYDPSQADLVVLVTCVVIGTTERAMVKRIRQLAGAPRLVVTGCMATASREKALEACPRALLVPPGDLAALSEVLSDLVEDAGRSTLGQAPRRDSYGIVPIATGCRGSCSYCITRLARGALRSRSFERISEGVSKAVAEGPNEVQLTAQDAAAYGSDLGTDLPSLVHRLCGLPGDFRLRVGMMNPASAHPIRAALAVMYREPKVFKFLHLPVQSGSDSILADMRRGHTVREFEETVAEVRRAVPEVTLSTDLIVGYPGETEEDHMRNVELVRRVRPDIVNVTRFSARPGTSAAEDSRQVPGWKAKQRSRELTALRFEVALERNNEWVGRRVRALATERGKGGSTILRTDEYKQVVVARELALRRFYDIAVTDATPTHLVGRTDGGG